MFHRASTFSLVAIVALSAPLEAQIMARRGSLGVSASAQRMLVANPFTTSQADSAVAVAIGDGLRERMSRSVAGRDFNVLTREQMNTALSEWGYPADAILNAVTAQKFAVSVTARTMVTSTVSRNQGGQYAVTARLIGANEPAGYTITAVQEPGQNPKNFGERIADMLRPGIRALSDARGCVEQAATNPQKAAESAAKALNTVPNHGLAEFCLGALAAKTDSVSPEAVRRYRNAVIGDPLSIEAYRQIGVIQQVAGDSSGVVETYQTMLRVEPTNQILRDQAFTLFQRYDQPGAAEEVADEGIRLDPSNTDWYDLKSNACLQQSKFGCAVDQLELIYGIDSTRADTAFFRKITLSARFGEDTTRFVRWARQGAEKFPADPSLVDELSRAYAFAGQGDSAVAVTQRLLELDPTRTEAMLRTTQSLSEGGYEQARSATAFVPKLKEVGTEDDWNTFAQIMVNAASAARQAEDQEAQAELAQAILDVGATNPTFTSYAGFFAMEPLVPRFQELSQAIRANRSCAEAREYQELLGKFMPLARLATASETESISGYGTTMLGYEEAETTAANQAVSQYCS